MQELANGEGFVESILHYLWQKDPILQSVPGVNLPDTIIYRNNEICAWYFSQDEQVKQKNKKKLEPEAIIDSFLSKSRISDIVAVWIKRVREKNSRENLIYQYLNEEEFVNFVNEKTYSHDKEGILQRFVDPKSENNFVLRVIWANKLCFFEKVENRHKLRNSELDIYQRALTFEVAHSAIETTELKGTFLPNSLETICKNIVTHIENASFERYKVNRLTLIFKLDVNEKLWLLCCQKLVVDERKYNETSKALNSIEDRTGGDNIALRVKNISTARKAEHDSGLTVSIPENINEAKITFPQPVNLRLDYTCTNCLRKVEEEQIYEITLERAIEAWDFDHEGESQYQNLKEYKKKKQETKQTLEKNSSQEHYESEIQRPVSNSLPPIPTQDNFDSGKYKTKGAGRSPEEQQLEAQNFSPEELLIKMDSCYRIPFVIRHLLPKLREKRYLDLKSNAAFLDKKAHVCEDCYLNIMARCNYHENYEELSKHNHRSSEFFGVGSLKPEALANRFNRTRKNIQLGRIVQDEINPNFKMNDAIFTIDQYFPITGTVKDAENMEILLNKVGIKTCMRSEKYKEMLSEASKPGIIQYTVPRMRIFDSIQLANLENKADGTQDESTPPDSSIDAGIMLKKELDMDIEENHSLEESKESSLAKAKNLANNEIVEPETQELGNSNTRELLNGASTVASPPPPPLPPHQLEVSSAYSDSKLHELMIYMPKSPERLPNFRKVFENNFSSLEHSSSQQHIHKAAQSSSHSTAFNSVFIKAEISPKEPGPTPNTLLSRSLLRQIPDKALSVPDFSEIMAKMMHSTTISGKNGSLIKPAGLFKEESSLKTQKKPSSEYNSLNNMKTKHNSDRKIVR